MLPYSVNAWVYWPNPVFWSVLSSVKKIFNLFIPIVAIDLFGFYFWHLKWFDEVSLGDEKFRKRSRSGSISNLSCPAVNYCLLHHKCDPKYISQIAQVYYQNSYRKS